MYCGDDRPEPRGNYAFEITDVRRYEPYGGSADWLEFRWRALTTASRFLLNITFPAGGGVQPEHRDHVQPDSGKQEDEFSIPDADVQWSSVTIQAPAGGPRCRGCGTFRRTSLPESRSLAPGAADPSEINTLIEEVTLAAQTAAANRR